MKIEKIKNIIKDYEELYELATSKIAVIEKLDSQYTTSRGIENISFYDDAVSVTCDDTFMGCYDTRFFSFPTNWLTKTDLELEELVIIEKELRVEKERKAKEEKELKQKQEKEQKELEQYEILKAKFSQNKN